MLTPEQLEKFKELFEEKIILAIKENEVEFTKFSNEAREFIEKHEQKTKDD